MTFFSPLAFWLALSLPAILALYLLKRRYQDQPVSSTYLWRQALRDLEASSPWQKLRRNLLLYLQLAAAALLVLAAVRPALLTRTPTGDVIVVLDASASMQATDVAPSRFDAGKERVRALIDGLGPGDRMTLVLAAARPRVLETGSSDRNALRRALGEARVSSETADVEEALKVALAAVQGRSGESARVTAMVISDGRVKMTPRTWPMEVRYEQVGTNAGNLAVLAFSVSKAGGGGPASSSAPAGAVPGSGTPTGAGSPSGAPSLLGVARVANYGPAAVPVQVDILAGAQIVASREVELAPGEERDLTFTGLPPASDYQARLQPASGGTGGPAPSPAGVNSLAIDDTAYAVSPLGPRARALLVTAGNRFLERAISLSQEIEVYRATPTEYAALSHPESYSLVVFDGYTPETLPATNLWLLNPGEGSPMPVSAASPVGSLRAATATDPLLQYVSLEGWHIARSRRVDPGDWGRPLLIAGEGGASAPQAVAAAGEREGRRYVVWGFDIHDSDLPLRPAFPILVQNLLGWLAPSNAATGGTVRPGDLVPLTLPSGATDATVQAPDGRSFALKPGEPFAATDQPGIYRLVAGGEDGEAAPGGAPTGGAPADGSQGAALRETAFAVNVQTQMESHLKPAARLGENSIPGSGAAAAPDAAPGQGAQQGESGPAQASPVGPLGQRELWPLLTLVALAALTLEWWVSTRGY